jgi:hypothetical protein
MVQTGICAKTAMGVLRRGRGLSSLPPATLDCLREFKAVGKKGGEGTAVVSDNSLIERVAAVAEDSDLTLDAGVCLRVNCTL